MIKRDTVDYSKANVAYPETSRIRDTTDATVTLQVLANRDSCV